MGNYAYTFNRSINLFKGNWKKSNKANLINFDHAQIILKKELWKKRDYYEDETLWKKFHECDFNAFLNAAFDLNQIWFKNMTDIISLSEGRDLFIERGYRDSVTYYRLSSERRKPALEYVRKSPIYITMRQAIHELFPEKKNEKKIVKIENENLSRKCRELQKEIQKLQKENQNLKEENQKLKESIVILASGHTSEKMVMNK